MSGKVKSTTYELLRTWTNEALKHAKRIHRKDLNRFNEAINWGDLSCRRVVKCEDEIGNLWWMITIEEAHPDSQELIEWVQRYIKKKGFEYRVEVVTEW